MILPLLWEWGTRLSFQDQLLEPHFIASTSIRRPRTTSATVCESGCSTFGFMSPTKPSSPQLQLLQSPNICLPCLPRNSPMIRTSLFWTFRDNCLALSHMKTSEMRLNNTFHYRLKVDVHRFIYWTPIPNRMVLRGSAFEKWIDPDSGALVNGVINIRGDPG